MKTTLNIPLKIPHEIHMSENDEFDEFVLLLHGYQLDGRFMFKRFAPHFDQSVKVIAPNGPFLVPLKKETHLGANWEARYSWYFYDSNTKNFYINYEPAAKWLADICEHLNPESKPVTIIGYSQGGYIAPKAGELISSCKKVLGINSIFRSARFEAKEGVSYLQINGENDDIVCPDEARAEFDMLMEKGCKGEFRTVEAGHPLTRELLNKSIQVL